MEQMNLMELENINGGLGGGYSSTDTVSANCAQNLIGAGIAGAGGGLGGSLLGVIGAYFTTSSC